jgi:hypothetical protein
VLPAGANQSRVTSRIHSVVKVLYAEGLSNASPKVPMFQGFECNVLVWIVFLFFIFVFF